MAKSKTTITKQALEFNPEYLLNSLERFIFVVNTQGQIIFWNKALERISYTKEEAVGKSLIDIFPHLEDDAGLNWRKIIETNVLLEGRHITVSRHPFLIQKTKAGEQIYHDIKVLPLQNKDEKIIGAAVLFEDVTEKIQNEQNLVRESRSSGLANLSSALAHEIKNPLNSISLNIQMLQEELREEKEIDKESLIKTGNSLLAEIQRLSSTLTDFMKFSRQPLPHLALDDVNTCIIKNINLLKPQAQEKDIEIIHELGTLPQVPIDSNQFQQVIYNILLNAIQAIPQNGKIGVASYLEDNNVIIRIFDNGPGISEDIQGKIFDLFFSENKTEGSGLGLNIASQIIENHNGKISVMSTPGKGAVFTIMLPIKIIAPPPAT